MCADRFHAADPFAGCTFSPVNTGGAQALNAILQQTPQTGDKAGVSFWRDSAFGHEHDERRAWLAAAADARLVLAPACLHAQQRDVAGAARGASGPASELRTADRRVEDREQRLADRVGAE